MRIVLVGSGSTGKTVLSELYSEIHGVPLIKENIRETVELCGFKKSLSELSDLDYRLVNNLVRDYKERREILLDDFVADRCLIDNLIYGTIRGIYSNSEYISYYNYVIKHAKKLYDLLVFLPIKLDKFEKDGFRHPIYIEHMYELMLLGILNKEKLNFIEFNSWDFASPKEAAHALKLQVHKSVWSR